MLKDFDARHARMSHRSGAQVDQHQALVHAVAKTLKRLGIRHTVEGGSPFTADRDYLMDIVVRAGELLEASVGAYRNKGLLVNVTYADPQAATHL